MALNFTWYTESFRLAKEFKISRGAKTHAHVLVLEVSSVGNVKLTGWAEAVPYARYNESIESVVVQLEEASQHISQLADQANLTKLLPPGSARNLLDCALWDFRAKLENKSVISLLGMKQPSAVLSAQTLSVDSIETMQSEAKLLSHLPLLKVKLDANDIVEKMKAIHAACPNSDFIIDANESWNIKILNKVLPKLTQLNVKLIEQPLPADNDAGLLDINSPIALCADESCHTAERLPELIGKYQAINIKLDKTGGLSEALALAKAAKDAKLQIMLGCMVASSLAMAPIYLLSELADYVDLDGPVLVANDRENGFIFEECRMSAPPNLLWGTG
ncbi:N-acetyl-D-Glu racemase DgcA [Glaciecola petra]|uniref:Dipeptide epimerase n=1 Tax=Glaciecola petra TaxID=3075602 RepID=A0ABU2ZQB7_9ALTE|nr:N-acetyl-D-Glu racemase DgcA [Aestuariibacter sp. P117]MDT0594807.1 N-acetyl-D-Glu racemase DgcA [Aestuariibacter sp. P117]